MRSVDSTLALSSLSLAAIAPPTPVLLGYVHSRWQAGWVQTHRLYNLRAGGRGGALTDDAAELRAPLVLLYGPALERSRLWATKQPLTPMDTARMIALRYDTTSDARYHLLALEEPVAAWEPGLPSSVVRRLAAQARPALSTGYPVLVAWRQLAALL